jgi:uncharacterized protein YkwD
MRRLLLALLAAMLLARAEPARADEQLPPEAAAVEALVNAERTTRGLPRLWHNAQLSRSAQAHADAMATRLFLSHRAPDGSNYVGRAAELGYGPWRFLGENIAAGQKSPERVLLGWMSSARHRENVLAPDASEVGVGYATASRGPYWRYWVLEVGARTGRFGR